MEWKLTTLKCMTDIIHSKKQTKKLDNLKNPPYMFKTGKLVVEIHKSYITVVSF